MNYQPVESSQIEAVGYEPDSKTLGVKFLAKGKWPASEYHYANVPPQIHRAMMAAASVGSFFTAEIKSRADLYPYTKQGEVLPPAPENPDSALLKVDKMTPEQIFVPGTMDPILTAIRDEVTRQAAALDPSTKEGLKAIGSLAFKVTKSKTFIESQRKSLVASEKKRLQAIDTEGRRIWDILEGIAAEVRKPLTEWEQIDKDRIARHEKTLLSLLEAGKVSFGVTSAYLLNAVAAVEAVDPATTEEFAHLATAHKAAALRELNAALKVAQEVENQQAENARLRAESAERETQELAISAARLAREAAERESEAALAKANAEKQQAEDRAAAAERRALQAVEEERARAAEAKAKEAEAQAKREANKKHVKAVDLAAVEALQSECGMEFNAAADVVSAISNGKIPAVSISY